MNATRNIILGVVAGMIILCVGLGVAGFILFRSTAQALGTTMETNAQQVSEISDTMAEYDLPAGFGNGYAAHIAGFTVVGYTGNDGHSHVYFVQIPAGVKIDQGEIERQLDQAAGRPQNRRQSTRIVDQVPTTIRGQETTLVLSEGINSDDQPFREATAMFQGRGGQTLVVYETPTSSWNQADVDAFLASIR